MGRTPSRIPTLSLSLMYSIAVPGRPLVSTSQSAGTDLFKTEKPTSILLDCAVVQFIITKTRKTTRRTRRGRRRRHYVTRVSSSEYSPLTITFDNPVPKPASAAQCVFAQEARPHPPSLSTHPPAHLTTFPTFPNWHIWIATENKKREVSFLLVQKNQNKIC